MTRAKVTRGRYSNSCTDRQSLDRYAFAPKQQLSRTAPAATAGHGPGISGPEHGATWGTGAYRMADTNSRAPDRERAHRPDSPSCTESPG